MSVHYRWHGLSQACLARRRFRVDPCGSTCSTQHRIDSTGGLENHRPAERGIWRHVPAMWCNFDVFADEVKAHALVRSQLIYIRRVSRYLRSRLACVSTTDSVLIH